MEQKGNWKQQHSFQSEGRSAIINEELKIRERGIEIEEAVFLSIWDEIASGPGAVSGGI